MHNFITKIIWGQGGDASLYLVSIEHLRLAAKDLYDEILSKILECSYDKHSHACSLYVATHRELQAKLAELGFHREAVFLESLGLAWRAWKQRGLTFGTRLFYIFHLRLTIYAIFGKDALYNAGVLRSTHVAGVPTNQLLDLLAAMDVIQQIYIALSPGQRATINASSLGTRNLESSFSFLSSN